MRKAAPALIILIAIAALPVLADTITTYDINFEPDPGSAGGTPIGSFTYDSTVPAFSDFVVVYDGYTFGLTASANAPSNTGGLPACVGSDTGAAASFDLLSGSCSNAVYSAQISPYQESFGFLAPETACEYLGPCIMVSGNDGLYAPQMLIGSVGSFSITPVVAATPEPATFGLTLGAMFVCAAVSRWRKRFR